MLGSLTMDWADSFLIWALAPAAPCEADGRRMWLSPPKLPKLTVLPGWALEGGRPPLADGWGIGDGEC